MKSISKLFRGRFVKWYQPDPAVKERLESLARSNKQEVSCNEVHLVLKQFAETVQRGENVLIFMPLIRQHLDVCPACRDEYETLLGELQPTIES